MDISIDVVEALRYLGAANADDATRRAGEEAARALQGKLKPRYVFRESAVALQ